MNIRLLSDSKEFSPF